MLENNKEICLALSTSIMDGEWQNVEYLMSEDF